MANKGSFTFIAIIYTLVIVILALSISYYIKSRLSDIEAFSIKTESYLNLRSYINIINFCLANGKFSNYKVSIPSCEGILQTVDIPLDGTPVKISEDIYLSIQDTNGLISLWSSDSRPLKNLVKKVLGYSETEADSFVSSLLDWIDTDDFKRVNGAERFDYIDGKPKPRNYFFQYWQEPSYVKGMNFENYSKIKNYVTILSNYGFNPNTAPAEVLSAYLDIDTQMAQKVVEYRKSKVITSNSELFYLTGKTIDTSVEGIYFFPYNSFIVKVYINKNQQKILSAEFGASYKGGNYNIIYLNIN